ncbi:MAG TPA: hypothetical protein VMZ28_24320 [Kofleriaceae bacterium]|nr:hypothetical protein [Kofleriaceae bacterium]
MSERSEDYTPTKPQAVDVKGRTPEAELRDALAADPTDERAAGKLTTHLIAMGRFSEAAAIIEAELDALTAIDEPAGAAGNGNKPGGVHVARRAERHRQVAALWEGKLGRIDRALHHWQKAWQLEPLRTEALESARALYASLGKPKMVAQLYEAELEILGASAPKARRATLELELGRLLSRHGDAGAAAQHLENALALAPDSQEAREALAEIYASPSFVGQEDAQRRAGELFVEIGRRRMATEDTEAAILYLRRALGVDPFSQTSIESLENALIRGQKWEELDRLYRQVLAVVQSDADRETLLRKRADLVENQLGDREELKRVLEQVAALEPPGNPSYIRLRQLYTEDEDWSMLAALLETEIEAHEDDPHRQLRELLELATIVREHLGDRDRAAEILHRVLTIDPRSDEALTRYGDHFRERRDWRGLADLNEFALENIREAGGTVPELVRRLEELAHLAELRLGDMERAIATWRRVEELDPENPRAHESLRRLLSRAKMWEQLVGMLEQEAQNAIAPEQRADALRRIAQVYRERQVNPRRAIQLYEEILTLAPSDEAALKALGELYEREGDDGGLASTIRRQLDIDLAKVTAELDRDGKKATTAREWPVAKRVERLTALRRLATMYEQRLADVEGVVFACTGVLEILPGDRDAVERMERVLDKAGDQQRLEQTLEYHAASATGPAERAKVLKRLARLAEEREDEQAAMDRWEQVLKAVPSDQDALSAAADLYDKLGRWGELAVVLERALMTQKPPEPGTPMAAKRSGELKRYARVVDDKLGDPPRATRAWKKVLEIVPRDRDALDALARLHEQQGQWRELADVLEKQAPLHREDDPAKAAEVAFRRARLLEERLGAPADAARALEALVRDLDPANVQAHQALRRLYEARGEFEAAVRVAERELYLTDEPQRKLARGLEIGFLCRDRLSDPNRALMAFERVLSLAPDHEEALAAAAELYAQVGDWPRHVMALERRVGAATEVREKRALMQRIAQVTAERLGDHMGAFAWYRRAHAEAPDAATIAELRRASETYGLWRELAEVYEDQRRALWAEDRTSLPPPADLDAATFVVASREVAQLAERRLGDRARAIDAYTDALRVQPHSADFLAEVERIAGEGDAPELWSRLLLALDLPLAVADRAGRVALYLRRARLREERLADPIGAMEELLRAFSWGPERDDVHAAVVALAERTRAWPQAMSVEAALFERAPTLTARLEALRRKAHVCEEKMGDRVRAFRVHLAALLLAPEDEITVAHLWRLAREIGPTYAEADRTPRPEPPAAHVEPPGAGEAPRRAGRQTGTGGLIIDSTRNRGEPTTEISASDLLALDPKLAGAKTRRDATMALEIEDLVEVVGTKQRKSEPEPTMELRTEDLVDALNVLRSPAGAPPLPTGRKKAATMPPPLPGSGKMPPLPPPRVPQIKRGQPPMPVVAGQRGAAPARRGLPGVSATLGVQMPARSYESPWEELATAYEIMPAADAAGRRRWQFRAAEIWETGAGDVPRAFDVLAKVLDAVPDDLEVRARLQRLASDHGEWDRLADLYEAAAEEGTTPEGAAGLYMEVAAIRATQGRGRDTEGIYRRVLGMRPDDALARERLEALYRGEARWVDLAAALEERTDPRLGAAVPMTERPALLRELAALYSEKLQRPHDAIDALERLRAITPDDVDVMDQLAALYSEIGRWSKVIEVLNKIGEAAEGTQTAREALRTIGHIYEVELELPDRAIDAYQALVERWSNDAEAYAALDRLFAQHGRHKDLDEVLKRRAALAKDADEKVELLRRRARVLMDHSKSPEDAAAALRHARTIKPDDPGLADDLVQALVKAGREREAAAVLEGRISALKSGTVAEGDIAALLIRLAALRADELKDPEGARIVLNEALALVPDHPTALSTLARLATAQKDPRTYADARMREAEVLTDVDAKVEAFMDAGTTLRDQVHDVDTARRAFEKVLALRPYHADATWALSTLVEQSGDVNTAIDLLKGRLEGATLEPMERAQVLTQLAALSRQAGVDAVAQKRLLEALEVVPDHLPAILARADLMAEKKEWDGLIGFIEEVMPRVHGQSAETRAELLRRKAIAFEALEASDEAYQTLLEADRTNRNNLLVKLALGENRYRGRRWREAALHLGSLSAHPQATMYPAEVAEGLYHAALAEIRSLRPDKAEAFYERAIELKPNYAPALHAMAELAMEKGDARRAADLLTRQASATDDPPERMRLFEALGDMALLTLGDEMRAKLCYEAAVNAAEPLESKHLPLLAKLLERQDLASDHAGAGRTAELMASFAQDADSRNARLKAAAENYLTAGQGDKARAAAERAIATDPYDLVAVDIASDIAMRERDPEAAAAMLGRALQAKEVKERPVDDVSGPRMALLWSRLGDARLARGDAKGAIPAYQQAIQLAVDSDGAMRGRRGLLELWKDDKDRREVLIEFRRVLAADTLALEDVVGYARALCEAGHGDGGLTVLDLAVAMGHAPSNADVSFQAVHPARVMAEDDPYKGQIDADARAELIADEDDQPMAPILAALWDAAPLLWADVAEAQSRAGMTGARKLGATTDVPAATIFTRVARALDAPATVLYATDQPEAADVTVLCVAPPAIVLGPRLHGRGDAMSDLELRFLLAQAAELARPERIIAAGLSPEQLAALCAGVSRVFGRSASDPAATREDDELLRTTLPVRVRTQLEKLLGPLRGRLLDTERFQRACKRAADRAGLLVCGDVDTAVRLGGVAGPDGKRQVRHLHELVLKRGYLAARGRLGIGATK